MADQKKKLVTPVGFVKWAHVHTPKAPFKDDRGQMKGDPKYQIDLCFSIDDPAWRSWASELKAQINALPTQVDKNTDQPIPHQMTIKKEMDADEKPTGRYYVTFKTGEKFKPGVFDKYGKAIPPDVLIGNDSKARVAYMPSDYTAFGGGINLYLNAVQVVDLVEYKGQSAQAHGFTVEASGAGGPPQAEDDLPF